VGPATIGGTRTRTLLGRALVLLACLGTGAGAGAGAGACTRPVGDTGAEDVHVALSLLPDPPLVGEARVALRLSGPDGEPLSGATVQVEGNMDHAGMTPVFADLVDQGEGRYAGTLGFTMGGDWFLLVRGTFADGRAFERQVDVPGVRSP
jgi:hypothetical protein